MISNSRTRFSRLLLSSFFEALPSSEQNARVQSIIVRTLDEDAAFCRDISRQPSSTQFLENEEEEG